MSDLQDLKLQHSLTVYKHFFPQWQGNKNIECFAHEDTNPSLSIYQKSGEYRHYCHACNVSGDCIDLIGQFDNIPETVHRINRLKDIACIADSASASKKKITKTYDYTDGAGALLFQTVRYAPKDFRQRRPDGNGGYIWNLEGVRPVPYNLPEVLKAPSVCIVEGEKDADNLYALGIVATCNAQGAGKWRPEYAEYFRGKQVAILPDNDEPGRKHAEQVAISLRGITESLRVVALPGLASKGDVSDWIESHRSAGKTNEAIRARLIELIGATACYKPVEKEQADPPRYSVISIKRLLTIEIPPREYILSPWLPTQGLTMLHAFRGVGKTLIGMTVAVSVAGGSDALKWKAPKPRRVLFLDGEMPASVLRERFSAIIHSFPEFDPDMLQIMTPDLQRDAMPNIASLEGAGVIDSFLDGVELVIVDNLSTLTQNGGENKDEPWIPVQEWALRLRRQGVSVLFIHHDGKGGQQRGHSKKEDILDTVIQLKRPGDYNPAEGARFEVHFSKARGLHGDDVRPFEALLTETETGGLVWTTKDLEQSITERVAALLNDGVPQHEIAELLGIAKGTVSKHKKRAQGAGLAL